jgi:hypothetical protein
MMVIPREAKKITYSTNIRALKQQPLSAYQKAVAIGSLLGDACVASNWSKTNYRLQIRQSKAQEAYVTWKYQIFSDFVLTPPQHYARTQSVWFRTISHPDITELHKMFYREGKKIIPTDIAQWLKDPHVVAIWFMDDGNIVRNESGGVRGYHLNTQSFTRAENQALCILFKKVLGIECTVHKNNGYSRLYIGAQHHKLFADLVRSHILPSLEYKIG